MDICGASGARCDRSHDTTLTGVHQAFSAHHENEAWRFAVDVLLRHRLGQGRDSHQRGAAKYLLGVQDLHRHHVTISILVQDDAWCDFLVVGQYQK